MLGTHRTRRRKSGQCVHRPQFPRADATLAQHFYSLFGAALLAQIIERPAEEVMQSMRVALLAHQTGIGVQSLLDHRTHLCGPHTPRSRRK